MLKQSKSYSVGCIKSKSSHMGCDSPEVVVVMFQGK